MPVHIEFTSNHAEYSAICSNHKGRAFARQRTKAFHAKQLRHFAARVRKQREAQIIFLIECFLPIHRIGADSHALGTEFLELFGQVTEMTAFARSTRCHRLRIKEKHHRSRLKQARKSDFVSVLILRSKIRDEIVGLHSFRPPDPERSRVRG